MNQITQGLIEACYHSTNHAGQYRGGSNGKRDQAAGFMTGPVMQRRKFVAAFGATLAAWPFMARAQQRFKMGLLDTGIGTPFTEPFMRKLEELGYVEGRNLVD